MGLKKEDIQVIEEDLDEDVDTGDFLKRMQEVHRDLEYKNAYIERGKDPSEFGTTIRRAREEYDEEGRLTSETTRLVAEAAAQIRGMEYIPARNSDSKRRFSPSLHEGSYRESMGDRLQRSAAMDGAETFVESEWL